VRVGSLPDDLVPEVAGPEHPVQQQLQIVARGRVAVQIQAAGRFQHAVELDQPRRHHREIRHHVVLTEKLLHRAEQVGDVGIAARHHLVKGLRGFRAIVPAILERLDLAVRGRALGRLEEDVVVGVGVERRVEIDQVDALVRNVLAQHLQIVAIVKLAHIPAPAPCKRSRA
jgi:hypothetical protein